MSASYSTAEPVRLELSPRQAAAVTRILRRALDDDAASLRRLGAMERWTARLVVEEIACDRLASTGRRA